MASQVSETDEIQVFTNARGQKLRRWCLSVDSAKAICILLHGIGDHILAYEDVAKALLENHNISLHGYDQVGHGRSEGVRVDIHDFQHYVDDAIQFVDIIKSEYPDIPVFVMGHSMGGLVLGQALLSKPDLCSGVIMYAAAVHANPQVVTPFKVTMAKLLSRVFPSFPVGGIGEDLLTRNKDELQRLKTDTLRYQGRMKARWGHNTLKALVDFNERMSEITIPIFIAHGDDDQICHIDGSTKLEKTVSSKDKTFKVYEKCYHRLHTEPDGCSEKFINDVGEWISSRV